MNRQGKWIKYLNNEIKVVKQQYTCS